MRVYEKILVTIDCSEGDRVIVDHVARLALQNEAAVDLLHVVHAHTRDQRTAVRQRAERCLQRCEEKLRAQGVDAHIVLCEGEPEEEIVRVIEQGHYDLVAMATHGHGWFADLLFGSVSNVLKHRVGLPILLVKSDR